VTHPRIYRPPSSPEAAVAQVEAWLGSPTLVLLAESDPYWPTLRQAMLDGQIMGPVVHDARVAALCASNGVRELWTADRDFGRFPGLTVVNPLVGR
jgi:predicted nucleic acid-binding protein